MILVIYYNFYFIYYINGKLDVMKILNKKVLMIVGLVLLALLVYKHFSCGCNVEGYYNIIKSRCDDQFKRMILKPEGSTGHSFNRRERYNLDRILMTKI